MRVKSALGGAALAGPVGSDREEQSWGEYHRRMLLNECLPDGFFSVLIECGPIILRLAKHGLPIGRDSIPDISIGMQWAKHWIAIDGDSRFGKREKFMYRYPEDFPQSKVEIEAWIYPDDALSYFRRWLRREYVPKFLWKYMRGKVKAGALSERQATEIAVALDNWSAGRS